MDFITGHPLTQQGHDSIWVIVDRLTKSAHFVSVNTTYYATRLLKEKEMSPTNYNFLLR